MTINKQPSCDDPFDNLLPVHVARARLTDALHSVSETETVSLINAIGRALSVDVVSPVDVPGYTNSAMDGYAIASSSIPATGVAQLKILGTAWAGKVFSGSVDTGEAVRIFTGGLMPEGCDTVVIQEHVTAEGDKVTIDSDVQAYKNVRLAGEDVQQNHTVLEAGTQLNAAEVGVLASLGINNVDVYRRLRVAFFTTGDELCALDQAAGTQLEPGMLFDSNRYSLHAMLKGLHVDVIDLGIVRDSADATRVAMQKAAQAADVIITSGGVSAGDADFVTQVFHELGDVSFWKLAMRPGRPLAFGQIGNAFLFGLPGNPVAVMVTFLQFVQPAIKQMMGIKNTAPFTINAVCQSKLRKSQGRVEYQRGVLGNDENGNLMVTSTGKQGAGRISSMSAANCLIVIAAELSIVSPGDVVEVQPFHGLFS